MRLSWQEIRGRARRFSERWQDAHYEKGETQSFYNEFFDIFGVDRKRVAVFEKKIELIERNKRGFIDLFWPSVLLVEQKSAGKDLLKAEGQAQIGRAHVRTPVTNAQLVCRLTLKKKNKRT